MIIDMARYIRLGKQRLVFDNWLRDAGLLDKDLIDKDLIEIRFGEGLHQCTRRWRTKHGMFQMRGEVITNDDGTTTDNRELVTTTFGWRGPLPPASVLERLQEIEYEGIDS